VICIGCHEAWTSVYIPQLSHDNNVLKITRDESLWITLVFFLGTLIGCSISLAVTDKFGRKPTILMTAVPFFISFITLAYAKSIIVFYIIRIIAGVATGLTLVVLPLYICEIADPQIRGALGTFIYIFNLLGFLFMNVLGSYVSIKISSLIFSTIPMTLTLTFIWMPESPYFLAMKQNFIEARISLVKFNRQMNVENDFERLRDVVKAETENSGKFCEIFTKLSNRKALFIEFILLNGKQLTGDDLFDVYAQLIFAQFLQTVSPTLIVAVYYVIKLIMTVISSLLIDTVGRRPVLFFSFLFSGIILLLLGIYLYLKLHTTVHVSSLEYIPISLLILFAVFYSFIAPVPAIMVGELFPMNVKVFASLLCEIYFAILSMIVIYFFEMTYRYLGTDVSFFTFSFSCFFHFVLVYFFVLETKGKTLEEIQTTL
jgi:MFS family permease